MSEEKYYGELIAEELDLDDLEDISGGILFRRDRKVYEVVGEDKAVLGQYGTLDEAIRAARRRKAAIEGLEDIDIR